MPAYIEARPPYDALAPASPARPLYIYADRATAERVFRLPTSQRGDFDFNLRLGRIQLGFTSLRQQVSHAHWLATIQGADTGLQGKVMAP